MNIQKEKKQISDLDLAKMRYDWRRETYDEEFQKWITKGYRRGFSATRASQFAIFKTEPLAQHINLDLFIDLYLSEKRKLDSKH